MDEPRYLRPHQSSFVTSKKNQQCQVINTSCGSPIQISAQWHELKSSFLLAKPNIHTNGSITIHGYLDHSCDVGINPVLWLKVKNQSYENQSYEKNIMKSTRISLLNEHIYLQQNEDDFK